jgi:hypothetical protein
MAVTGHTSTSSTSDDSLEVFRPRAWRVFLLILALSGVFIACIEAALYAAGRLAASEYGWALLLVLWLLLCMYNTFMVCRQYAIGISATSVTGRSSGLGSWGWEQKKILLGDLDPVRSAKRGWTNRLFGNQRFYSNSGQSIYFLRATFPRDDVRKILELLNVRN